MRSLEQGPTEDPGIHGTSGFGRHPLNRGKVLPELPQSHRKHRTSAPIFLTMKHPPRQTAAAAHIYNRDAARLAAEINRSSDAGSILRKAFIDAQLHHDWSQVFAIENSLTRIEDRALARHLGNVAARAMVVSRLDDGRYAQCIPDGFEFGLAWLVCLVFVRTDPDSDTAFDIASEFHGRVTDLGGLGIDWGPCAMCVPRLAFGGPVRMEAIQAAEKGDAELIFGLQDRAQELLAQEVAASRGREHAHTVGYITWGTIVTGTNDPLKDLFNESIWCPGFDAQRGAELVALLGEEANEFEGDTFIHPEVLPADLANDFVRMMVTEQKIDDIVYEVVSEQLDGDLSSATVTIAKLVPNSLPYLDQLLVSFRGRANTVFQTYRLPRSGRPLEEDAELIAQMCSSRGIEDVRLVDLKTSIGANDFPGYSVDVGGNLVSPTAGALGDATLIARKVGWEGLFDLVDHEHQGIELLPQVMGIEKRGAMAVLGEHYTPAAWQLIKEALAKAGDPYKLMTSAMRRLWTSSPDDMTWMLSFRSDVLLPKRSIALAAQFKLADGVVVKATPSLLSLLGETDVGPECPSLYLRAGFDLMCLVLRCPVLALNDFEPSEYQTFVDSVLVQRADDENGPQLQMDIFLTTGTHPDGPTELIETCTLKLKWDDAGCLGDLRSQVMEQDEDMAQVLDLYAGVMLYMNSRDARVVKRNDRSEAAAVLGGLNRKKRRKEHYQAFHGAVDAIHVGPEHDVDVEASALGEHAHSSRAPHYRRGFVRFNQRVGKGRAQTRPVFIPPVLVNANKLAGGSSKKSYAVG